MRENVVFMVDPESGEFLDLTYTDIPYAGQVMIRELVDTELSDAFFEKRKPDFKNIKQALIDHYKSNPVIYLKNSERDVLIYAYLYFLDEKYIAEG